MPDLAEAARRRIHTAAFGVLQVGYNLIERQGADTLDYARGAGMGTLIRVPLAKGMLSGKYFTDWQVPADDVRHERFSHPDAVRAFRRLPELGGGDAGSGGSRAAAHRSASRG